MQLRGSHLVSLAILAGIGGWMFTGQLIQGGQADPNAETIAEREAKLTTSAFRVRVKDIQPSARSESLNLRGRTQADAMVSVRAETGGTVEARPVSKGQFVNAGDLLCVIEKGVRSTNLAQAKAVLVQAQEDYEATEQLVKRGFATKTKLRAQKSALDAALATVASAEQDMKRTEIRATVSGEIQSPLAEVGDNLSPGGVCVTLIDSDPMLFSGQVPERDVAAVKVGKPADVTLVSGEKVKGEIRYISPIADPNTRTFSVEISLPNPDRSLKDGMTATAEIKLDAVEAFQVKPSWLTLADDGRVGVRAVGADQTVEFVPVKIIAQEDGVAWVNGLTPGLKVITLGQNFVAAGEKVEAVTEEQLKALEEAAQTQQETKS